MNGKNEQLVHFSLCILYYKIKHIKKTALPNRPTPNVADR